MLAEAIEALAQDGLAATTDAEHPWWEAERSNTKMKLPMVWVEAEERQISAAS